MSIENEDLLSMAPPEQTSTRVPKQTKISYTRDFLLSLSDLEACKKLPSGFDESLLSEFEDGYHGIQDRARTSGSSALQGFRRSDYGSSPPTRGGSYRWDSRSSGRSDTDSQSDRDSESGRRYINQSRRTWQNSEHDGLLGSGSFPRPTGFGAGTSAPRLRANDNYQLNRSNEPYHPPRPYKAAPRSRREANDSYNDETFGSTECTSEDRVEEEKKRRAEFEMMRKEQHKALKEKLKSGADKPKEDPLTEIAKLMENPRDDKKLDEFNIHAVKQPPENDSEKLSTSSQALPSRPLVPPGFKNNILEKNSGTKSLTHPNAPQIGKFELEGGPCDERELVEKMAIGEKQSETTSSASAVDGKTANVSCRLEPCQVNDVAAQLQDASNLADVSDVLGNGEILSLHAEKVDGHKITGESNRSTSLLEKLFGSALTGTTGPAPDLIEDQDTKAHDLFSLHDSESSKFARWFNEEGKKTLEDLPSEKSNDLLLLIVGGEKAGSSVSDTRVSELISSESNPGAMTSPLTSAAAGTGSSVLTCEDLEQSILSEISGNKSNSQPPKLGFHAPDLKAELPIADTDNCASQHLLSLLQKGMESLNVTPNSFQEKECPDKHLNSEAWSTDVNHNNASEGNAEKLDSSVKSLTLETLFGTAFMKELQSVDAPVSVQKNSAGLARTDSSETYGLPFPISSAAVDGITSRKVSHDSSILASNDGQQTDLDRIGGHWLGFDDHRKKVELPRLPIELDSKVGGFDGPIEVRLPEEDSLLTISDPVNPQSSMLIPSFDVANVESLSSSSNRPANIAEKLAALGAAIKDERSMVGGQEGLRFFGGPYDMAKPEVSYQNLHGQPSSVQFQPQQMNHRRSLFLDSHPTRMDPQLRFMGPEAMMHHDTPTHHQFPANMIRPSYQHPNVGLPEFDNPIHHPMLQQMHMPGNLPPHVPRGFPGGPSMSLHPNNNPAGYAPEHSAMQGFPISQRRSNFGGIGMPLSGPELGGMNNPPEALQRLLEMERRSNPKQAHPFPPGSHTRPMYGHELDTGFWHR